MMYQAQNEQIELLLERITAGRRFVDLSRQEKQLLGQIVENIVAAA